MRESGRTQALKGNLQAQERNLRKAVEKLELRVVRVFREIGSGYSSDLEQRAAAFAYARENGVALITESADRFLRHRDYSKTNQEILPSLGEWERLADAAQGVRLATLLEPDVSPRDVRAYQTARGIRKRVSMRAERQSTRTEPKKIKRMRLLKRVVFQRRFFERSYGEISKRLGLPRSTVKQWVGTADSRVCQFLLHDLSVGHSQSGNGHFCGYSARARG